jgi:hypothetical protein
MAERFDVSRVYVVVGPKRVRSTHDFHSTSGVSFVETLHRSDCRYVAKIRATDPERIDVPWDLFGVSIEDAYLYCHGLPEKVCKVCLPDWYEYQESMAPSALQSYGARRRREREQITASNEFFAQHSEWQDAHRDEYMGLVK